MYTLSFFHFEAISGSLGTLLKKSLTSFKLLLAHYGPYVAPILPQFSGPASHSIGSQRTEVPQANHGSRGIDAAAPPCIIITMVLAATMMTAEVCTYNQMPAQA